MRSVPPSLTFFSTPPHACSYLPGREAVTVFADPGHRKDPALYSRLSAVGFRRSGEHIYTPACRGCSACIAVRIPVASFVPRRSQRRVQRRNHDLRVVALPARFHGAHYGLYRRYVAARHPGGGMDEPSRSEYVDFLTSTWSETVFFEFSRGERLLAVAVTDVLPDGLSAVYTFFDPDAAQGGLGTYAILWQIAEAGRRALPWFYLGYWIEDCAKMRYKSEFRPHEQYVAGGWRGVGDTEPCAAAAHIPQA